MADDTINYDRPTLSELLTRTRSDMAGKVTNSLALLRGSVEWGLASAMAGAVSLTYGAIDQLYRNILADRASTTWLERIASRYSLTRNVAHHGGGPVEFTWTAGGQPIPDATVLTDAAGNEYVTVGVTADPGGLYPNTANATVLASYTGAASNLVAGTALTITTPIAGITSEGEVDTTFTGGIDVETDDDLRDRTLDRIQNTPQGGAEADYDAWAKAVSGVEEVWIVQAAATLPFLDVIYTGSALAATVPTAIDAEKPIQAVPSARSVDNDATYQLGVSLDITAHSLTGYLDADVEDNIDAVVAELFDQEGGPSTTIKNSSLRTAIGTAEGLDYFTLDDVNGDATGLSDLTSGTTTVHYLTAIAYTWIP